ncbi:MAG: MFS transporter [Tepidisphaerales bacterium]
MGIRSAPLAAHVTLAGTTVLHAFTHAYATMFGPLYLLMRDDLGLTQVSRVTLLVTLYGLVYWLMAFPAGYLADHVNRQRLLGWGLIGNAACILAMGLTRRYELLVLLSVLAGLCGCVFHPAANALVPAHYPKAPGMAIGLLGIGSGLGFFAGPFYAGWSARHSTFGGEWLSDWQRPFVELGLLGLACGAAFLLLAREAPRPADDPGRGPPMPAWLRWRTLAHALAVSLREYASVGVPVLTALLLLKAYGYDTQRTGGMLGLAMLSAAVVNPLVVYFTAGTRRIPAHVTILVLSALLTAALPWFPGVWVLPALMALMTLLLASSAVGDAALTERVAPNFRGRVNGLFLTIVGGTAATSPFVVGFGVDLLGEHASRSAAYVPLYAALAATTLLATISAWTLARLEHRPGYSPDAGRAGTSSSGSGTQSSSSGKSDQYPDGRVAGDSITSHAERASSTPTPTGRPAAAR